MYWHEIEAGDAKMVDFAVDSNVRHAHDLQIGASSAA